jgi:predicted TIM-barrel fold metal-dependent hydrolase
MTQRIDSHAHIFSLDAPLIGERRYTPHHAATEHDYLNMLATHGIQRGVLIQPSFLGTDNDFMVAALRRHPGELRGIAVVDPTIGEGDLDQLDAAGVVGVRLNLIGRDVPDFRESVWRRHFDALVARDWQVEVHCHASVLGAVLPALLESGVKIVVDHFGRPDPALGTNDPGFRYLLSLAGSGQVWVKLSGAYRNGRGANEPAIEAAGLLRDAFGLSRLVWGSDWPHTMFEDSMTYEATLSQLSAWLPDEADREIVMGETAALLFRWRDSDDASQWQRLALRPNMSAKI